MVIWVALLAAVCYAAAMVLQQHEAQASDISLSLRPGLVADLARHPLWWAGLAANGAGYALRYVALARGSLVLVQPLLVTSLLFALPVSARWHHYHLRRQDWAGAAAIAAGLVLFLVAARPGTGRSDLSGWAWLVTTAVVVALAGVLSAEGRHLAGPARARLLAAAAGVLLAFVAALTKATGDTSGSHLVPSLARWEPYALLATVAVAMVVVQSAFGAGPLTASLPVLMVVEPVAGVVMGAVLFGEHVAGGPLSQAWQAAGLLVMTAGVAVVATSIGRRRVVAAAPHA